MGAGDGIDAVRVAAVLRFQRQSREARIAVGIDADHLVAGQRGGGLRILEPRAGGRVGRIAVADVIGAVRGGDGRGFPRPVCFGAQDPETGSGGQMGLQTERVGDGGVAGAEPLISALGCELPLLSFSSADDQVGVLDPVILVYPARPIVARQAWITGHGPV
jgi:hypothetical protein